MELPAFIHDPAGDEAVVAGIQLVVAPVFVAHSLEEGFILEDLGAHENCTANKTETATVRRVSDSLDRILSLDGLDTGNFPGGNLVRVLLLFGNIGTRAVGLAIN